ncbi:response regulator [Lichenihabitans sp. PAMC28606]|uniref:response regulator n=1 Tax=Lichenihabitans sp. PAMC28606 TaxID=2880932 RepID=UPI0039B4508A
MTAPGNPNSERILVLSPQGRDAVIARQLLTDAGFPALTLSDLAALRVALADMAGAVLVTEEAIRTADLAPVNQWLADQPSWSDMPFIILTSHGGGPERNPTAARLSKALGNVTFLERPFHPTTLISHVHTALRGRRRQYEARDRLEALRVSEERLQHVNATLEQRVACEINERTVAEEAMRQSQKMEAVGQLTGGVAHDFNNLLTIIRSSVDLLRRPDLNEERRRRYMDAVSDTVDRAAKLTGQLLAFARRQALTPEVFDVSARLHSLTDMLDTVTGARIRIVRKFSDHPCFVEADVSQFETAVVNMAVNARDAMNGEGILTLHLEGGRQMPEIRGHASAPGPFIELAISDTGAGIEPELLVRIFEPFFTTKEVGKGTGLGLSQVFGFTKQSGGDVSVDSQVGKGTTIRLYLPQVAGSSSIPVRDAWVEETNGARHRVLIVEDNIEVGQFALQILQDFGYVTTLASNGEEALARLNDVAAYDIVFSDVVMPGMGGIELAKTIRHRWPRLPVVLTSGYSHVLSQEGSHGFELLHKPYSADQLSRVLLRVLRGSLATASPGGQLAV